MLNIAIFVLFNTNYFHKMAASKTISKSELFNYWLSKQIEHLRYFVYNKNVDIQYNEHDAFLVYHY